MLIKYQDRIYNLDNLIQITKGEAYYPSRLRFEFPNGSNVIDFSSPEEAEKALEHITDAYRWQRQVCDLG
jgi:hypothetical protein